MKTGHSWWHRLFGYSEAGLQKELANAEAAQVLRLVPVTSELSVLQSQIGMFEDMAAQRMRLVAELQTLKANLEMARREAGIIRPHLSRLAEQHAQEIEAEVSSRRTAAEQQVAAAEEQLAQERANFQILLQRLQALAEGLLIDEEQAAAGFMQAEQAAGEWRPGTIGPSGPAAAPAERTDETAEPVRATPEPATETAEPATPDLAAAEVAMGVRTDLWSLLVGKTVGADLVLPNGTLLARAGTPITHQLVDQARSANVLSDLILDMTFAPEGN